MTMNEFEYLGTPIKSGSLGDFLEYSNRKLPAPYRRATKADIDLLVKGGELCGVPFAYGDYYPLVTFILDDYIEVAEAEVRAKKRFYDAKSYYKKKLTSDLITQQQYKKQIRGLKLKYGISEIKLSKRVVRLR